jgi:thiol-disulfide isomerase/thioredoxin
LAKPPKQRYDVGLMEAFPMKSTRTLFAILFSFTLTQAALKSADKTHVILTNENNAKITVDPGFHFNLEAPTFFLNNKIKSGPANASPEFLEFKWSGSLSDDAKIQYYVCDDAKTVCEPHIEILTNKKALLSKPESTKTALKSAEPLLDHEGFIQNDLDFAFRQAKRKSNLVLIDFTASWCPACIRLIHESFNTETFKTAALPYTLVKIDVDLETHHALLEKYSIRAFPTLVITNDAGVELDRILDFLPPAPLAKRLTEISTNRSFSIQKLKLKAKKGDKQAALFLAKNAYRAQQHQECLNWFRQTAEKPFEYYSCLVSQSENFTVSDKIETLKVSINALPNSYYAIDWRMRLANLFTETNKAVDAQRTAAELEKLIVEWLKSPEKIQQAYEKNELMELANLVIPELHYSLGDTYVLLGKTAESNKQYELAIEKTLNLKPSIDNPTIIIYLVHYLKKTHPLDESIGWLQKLAKAYPDDFTYLQRQASILAEAKQFEKALSIGQRAFKLSYGTNQLKTGLLLANIKKNLNQNQEAKALLKDLIESKSAQAKSNKHHVDRLKKALIEIN